MSENLISIFIGVISGVLSAGILFLTSRLLKDSLIPWFQHIAYKGVHIEGKWFSYNSSAQKSVLELKQDSDKVTGKLTAILQIDEDVGIDTVRTFDIHGVINNRFITLSLNHTDRSRIGVSTILLQVAGDGTLLQGVQSSYSPRTGTILASNIKIYRNEERAKDDKKKEKEKEKEKKKNRAINSANKEYFEHSYFEDYNESFDEVEFHRASNDRMSAMRAKSEQKEKEKEKEKEKKKEKTENA